MTLKIGIEMIYLSHFEAQGLKVYLKQDRKATSL